jgi:predicted RNA-binding protein with PIN domain
VSPSSRHTGICIWTQPIPEVGAQNRDLCPSLGFPRPLVLQSEARQPSNRVESRKNIVLVDGFNLLHAVVLKGRNRNHWWSTKRKAEVLALVECLNADRLPGCEEGEKVELMVVFDARGIRSDMDDEDLRLLAHHASVHHAPNADDWIVGMAEAHSADRVFVVSADRALQDRAARHGTSRLSPWQFANLCTEALPTDNR